MTGKVSGMLFIVLGVSAMPLRAEHLARDADLVTDEVTVTATRMSTPLQDVPASLETYTATQIQETINAATAAETVKFLPSVMVRERYIGDRNAILATRTAGTVSSAQTLVYADEMLLSNLLGNSYSYPPRWGIVSPEEIARVDMIYGPYSALYPGNSMGGVVNITTRMPQKFEAHANLQQFRERFELYGSRQNNDGTHASANIGNRVGDFSFWVGIDHLDAEGHPMSFATKTASSGSSAAGGTNVTGAYQDISEKGEARLVFGGYSIDHSIQDNGKIKVAYDFSPTLKAIYTLGVWQLDSDTDVDSYIRNAATGAVVYNSTVRFNNKKYTVSGLNPGHAEASHLMQGLDLKSDPGGPWSWHLILSDYDYRKDESRSASSFGVNQTGTLQDMEGTGWFAGDLRGEWHPALDHGSHKVTLGYHYDHYQLRSNTFDTTDWLHGGKGALNSASSGDTRTQAIYAQDAWSFARDWKLTVGGRWERWEAFDGMNQAKVGGALKSSSYADKRDNYFSPKIALAFDPSPAWGLRASFGQAYRYPTVAELFQTITNGSSLVQNNPDLKPEQVLSGELTAERRLDNGLLRVSLFQENKKDALYSQTVSAGVSACGSATCSYIQNVDSVRTRGVEFSAQLQDAGIHGLDLNGSVTYADAEILKDAAHPDYDGKHPTRIPDWMAKAVATYHQGDAWSYTLAARYSGRQYYYLDNSDTNPGTYNSASKYFFVDARVLYKFSSRWTASLGIDNLNNYKAYALHPYSQRTAFAQMKFDY